MHPLELGQALIHDRLARLASFNLVVEPQQHRAEFFLLIAVQVQVRVAAVSFSTSPASSLRVDIHHL